MTIDPENQPTEEQPEPRPTQEQPPRRLTRASDDRVLGGVAGGLGRYFGVDPIIPRIAFAALVFAGGFGFLAYVAAWLFVPDEQTGKTAASGSRSAAVAGIVVLIAAIAVVTGGAFLGFPGPGLFVLLVAGLLGYALFRAVGGDGGGSVGGRIVLVLVLGVLALVLMAAVIAVAALGGDAVIAGLVIAAGLMVAVGAMSGRLRWLLIPAVLVAAPAGLVAAADLDITGGIGERQYRPAAMADVREGYELGIGELVVDLREVDFPAGRTDVDLDLGIGRAVVLVPKDVCVSPDVRVGAGDAIVYGRGSAGVDVELVEHRQVPLDRPRLVLDAEIGIGELVVADRERDIHDGDFWHDWDDRRDFFGRDGDDHAVDLDAGGNACSATA